jgi:hypothetical protein
MLGKTLKILNSLATISDAFIYSYPLTVIKNPSDNLTAFLNVETLEEEFDEIGISNIREVNSLVQLIPDNEITLNQGVLYIKNDKQLVRYITQDVETMGDIFRVNINQLEKTKSVASCSSFNITESILENIRKVGGILKDSDVILSSSNGVLKITIGNSDERMVNTNAYSFEIEGDSTKDFKTTFKLEHFKNLPNGSYTANLKHNEVKDNFRLLLESQDINGLDIIMPQKSI